MSARLVKAVLATALMLLVVPACTHAAFPGPNGQIVYIHGHEGSSNGLSTISPDGTGNRQIVSTTARSPEWSPDGRRIAYGGHPSGVYIVQPDGSAVSNPIDGSQPAWSPDGEQIAFVREVETNTDRLFIANADGSGEVEVPGVPPGVLLPDWSPDGSRIVFGALQSSPAFPPRWDLYAVDPDGGNLVQLTSNTTLNEELPEWSPDGSKIAFVVRNDSMLSFSEGIWVMNPDGSDQVQLIGGGARHPAWSPDGTKIAFRKLHAGPPPTPHIWVMNADGSNQVELPVVGNSPDWQANLWPGHARPKGATPVRVPLVPTFHACGAPNETHGPPLAFPSCNPPLQQSTTLTVGTPDANGFAANGEGFVRFATVVGSPGGADEADVTVTASVSDVRCRATNAACPGGAGSDYAGSLMLLASLRITDKLNGDAGAESGTLAPSQLLRASFACVATADGTTGADCALSTTADALVPGIAPEGRRTIWQLGQAEVYDSGPNGTGYASCPPTCGNGDETMFMRQGLFVP